MTDDDLKRDLDDLRGDAMACFPELMAGTDPTRFEKYGYPLTCLHYDDPRDWCSGPVDEYSALSGTGTLITYCERHWGEAIERDQAIRERYPVHAPADFDPDYCGERWDDDY